MSWQVETVTYRSAWRGNQLRFATRGEAEANADHLIVNLPTAKAVRVVESPDPANVRWLDGQLAAPIDAGTGAAPANAAVILASGRSIRDICLPLLQACSVPVVAVNSAVRFAPHSAYVFTLDTTDLEARLELDAYRGQRVAAVPADYFDRRSARTGRFRKAPRASANIRYLRRATFTSLDPPDEIVTGCSGFGAMQFAYKYLGAREIFLLGCDHDDQGVHFYGGEPDPRQARNWYYALKYWNGLVLPPGLNIWNGSPASKIERFPKLAATDVYRMLGLPAVAVVTVLKCGGEYDERHVEWLQRQVGFPIVCLTDSTRAMRHVVSIPLTRGWPGWWSKMEMFRDDLCLGNFLYLDLDTVIRGGIPSVYGGLTETHVISDLYGQPWMQSCLMFVHHSSRGEIWEAFTRAPEDAMREAGPGGDQRFIDRYLRHAKRLEDKFPGEIVSYKADVVGNRFRDPRRGSLASARFVCFHGHPRPWQVRETWVPSL